MIEIKHQYGMVHEDMPCEDDVLSSRSKISKLQQKH